MTALKGGTFTMGSNEEISEKPVHQVTIKPFALSTFPVTVREWTPALPQKYAASWRPETTMRLLRM